MIRLIIIIIDNNNEMTCRGSLLRESATGNYARVPQLVWRLPATALVVFHRRRENAQNLVWGIKKPLCCHCPPSYIEIDVLDLKDGLEEKEPAVTASVTTKDMIPIYMNIYFATIFVNWDRVKTPDYKVVYNAAVLSLFSFHSETGRRRMFMPESRRAEPRPFCLPA